MRRILFHAVLLISILILTNSASAQGTWTNIPNGITAFYDIAAQGDFLWCGIPEGLLKLNTADMTYEIIPQVDMTIKVALGPDAAVWALTLGTTGSKLMRYDGTIWTAYTDNSLNTAIVVSSFAVGPDGIAWVGTYEDGLIRFDGATWTAITTEDGLPSNYVTSIDFGPDGTIWAGTLAGLCHYDGVSWVTETWSKEPEGNIAYSIAIDDDGVIWAAIQEGLLSFDGTTWKIYTTEEGLPHEYVYSIAIDPDGSIWIGSSWYDEATTEYGSALARYDGANWTAFSDDSLDNVILTSLDIGSDGVVWAETTEDRLFGFDGKEWKTFSVEGGPGQGRRPLVARDPEGVLWIGTFGRGVMRYDGDVWTEFTTDEGLAYNYITSITIAPDGTVWAGTFEGLSRFNGVSWDTFTWSEVPADNYVLSLAVDPDGVAWCGTPEGLQSFDGTTWTNYDDVEWLAAKPIYSIAVDPEGIVWVGTEYEEEGKSRLMGIYMYDGTTWTQTVMPQYLGTLPIVTCIHISPEGEPWAGIGRGLSSFLGGILRFNGVEWEQEIYATGYGFSIAFGTDGMVWTTTGVGVAYYDGERWREYSSEDGLTANTVYSLAAGADGAVWAGTDMGISMFEPNPAAMNLWTRNSIGHSGIPQKIGMLVPAPNGEIWAAINKDGIFRFDGEEWAGFNEENGLPSVYIYAAAVADDGTAWFATKNGIAVHDGINWTTYTTADGLSADRASSLAIGQDGTVWAGIYKGGVCRFDGASWKAYTDADGLLYDTYGIELVSVGPDNSVWAASRSGVSMFDGTKWISYGESDGMDLEKAKLRFLDIGPDGVVWYGTYRNGLYMFDGTSWTKKDVVLVANEATGLGSIAFDPKGGAWTATGDGVSRFDSEIWTDYTQADGLASGDVNSIVFEPDGTAWFATTGGVSRFDGDSWTKYTEHNGLSTGKIYSIAVGTDGKIWCGESGIVSLLEDRGDVNVEDPDMQPLEFAIHGNYPNPFNASTTIQFELPDDSMVNLVIYNIMGQKVRTLVSESRTRGLNLVSWDGRNDSGNSVSSGIYLIRLSTNGKAVSNRMMLLK